MGVVIGRAPLTSPHPRLDTSLENMYSYFFADDVAPGSLTVC